jgi:hypothetical protein
MKKNLLFISLLSTISFYQTATAQIGVFGVDANGNTTEKCSNEGWDKSDCSLTKIKPGNVLPDKKEVNCQGVVKTIYKTLEDGKPIMIFAEAWGCGPCWDSAGEKADYIQAHKSKINFWIPLCEYFGNDAECTTGNKTDRRSIEGWQNSFPGLKDAFMFLDNDRTFNLDGIPAQPGVGVIDPKTKKLVYSGYDFGKAEALAEAMANNVTANEERENVKQFSFYPNPAQNTVVVKSISNDNVITVANMAGKVVLTLKSSQFDTSLDLSNLAKGVYTLKVNNEVSQLVLE